MQQQYNTNIRFDDYKLGDNDWLKTKHYKSDESRKLSPRRVNFRIINVTLNQATKDCPS